MIFNAFSFLFLFLPAVLLLFYCPGLRALRFVILIAASFVFYAVAGIEHAIVLFVDIVWVYCQTSNRAFQGNKPLLAITAIPPVIGLLYYKYAVFLMSSIERGGSLLDIEFGLQGEFSMLQHIVLPAGISFFTFQIVGYAIDCYRGKIIDRPGFGTFALFVSFFPQLVAGPIVRLDQVRRALERLREFTVSVQDFYRAFVYLISGLAMKVLIADTLSRTISPLIADPDRLSVDGAVYLIAGYSFQIYFDFYGYSLAAIGLAMMFGVRLPDNFLRPYSALNPREFWRCWHVTLSFWIKDYLYRPLGGNEKYIRNIAITFTICGLWHGAAWTFVIWGLYHAALVTGYKLAAPAWNRMPSFIQHALTFSLVSVGWTLFIFDFDGISAFTSTLLTGGAGSDIMLSFPLSDWLYIGIAAFVCFGIRIERLAETPPVSTVNSVIYGLLYACLFLATLLFLDQSESFIYFRF